MSNSKFNVTNNGPIINPCIGDNQNVIMSFGQEREKEPLINYMIPSTLIDALSHDKWCQMCAELQRVIDKYTEGATNKNA